MNDKSIIVIGAGMAGLAAGCYGQMNGYHTRIFEMHDLPGGCCTTWERGGYKIDGCLHWLTGSRQGNPFYPIWQELGALQGRAIVDHREYARIEGADGRTFVVYCDVDELEQHMLDLAPEDGDLIHDLAQGIRACINFPMPIEKPRQLYGPVDGIRIMLRMVPYVRFLAKWGRVTLADFSQRFKNPFLRQVFRHAVNLQNDPDFPVLGFLMSLAWMDQKTAGYPVGGSLEFARAVEKRYVALGGEIHYESQVDKILVENARAVGVRLADGSEHRCDHVVAAADGHTVLFHMLDGTYGGSKVRGFYDHLPVSRPVVYISLGVARSFEDLPHQVTGIDFPLNQPIMVAGQRRERLNVQLYNFDPALAPPGKTVMRVYYATQYEYWQEVAKDPARYDAEKQAIADQVIAALERRFPGLAAQVEMRDVATPLTFERYTGNWQGTFLGWRMSTKTLRMRMAQTLPGLDSFYMAGQWVEPGGGVPTAAMSGRNAVQLICNQDGRPFITTMP